MLANTNSNSQPLSLTTEMLPSLFAFGILGTLFAATADATTLQEAQKSPEMAHLIDSDGFNRWYHAGISLVLLYVMLSVLVGLIHFVTRSLGHSHNKST